MSMRFSSDWGVSAVEQKQKEKKGGGWEEKYHRMQRWFRGWALRFRIWVLEPGLWIVR